MIREKNENRAQVCSSLSQYYRPAEDISDELVAVIDVIKRDNHTVHDRILSSYRYIRDTIKYIPSSFDDNGFIPKHPSDVIVQGVGGSKELSLLLATILSRLGIAASCCLVHTEKRDRIDEVPRPDSFNHVVVKISAETVCFIDPTINSHLDVVTYPIVPCRKGLVLSGGNNSLEDIPLPVNEISTHETITLTAYNAKLVIQTRLRGCAGQDFAAAFNPKDVNHSFENTFEQYRAMYPEIRRDADAKAVLTDDGVKIIEEFLIPGVWKKVKKGKAVFFYPRILAEYENAEAAFSSRLSTRSGMKLSGTTEVTVLSALTSSEKKISNQNEYFTLTGSVTVKDTVVTQIFECTLINDPVTTEQMSEYSDEWRNVRTDLAHTVFIKGRFSFSSIAWKWKILIFILFWLFCGYQFISRIECTQNIYHADDVGM
jgi:hypothetical protein